MNIKKALFFIIIISLSVCFIDICGLKTFADEDALYALCNKLGSLKRYEGKRIGYDDTKSESWEIGELIVAYGEDAIPYLIDVYKKNNSLIAQLFAARLVGEIDFQRGVMMLESFKNDERTIEIVFGSERAVMTVADLVKKEVLILEEQERKIRSTQDPTQTAISSKEE